MAVGFGVCLSRSEARDGGEESASDLALDLLDGQSAVDLVGARGGSIDRWRPHSRCQKILFALLS